MAAPDEMLTIAPPPARRIAGSVAWIIEIGPIALTPNIRSILRADICSMGSQKQMPAL